MSLKKIANSFNLKKQCGAIGVPLWSCPQFLFIVMGAVIIAVMITTSLIAARYISPELNALIIIILTAFLFIVNYIIIQAFERVVSARRNEYIQAQNLLKIKDQFVFIAAHELRAPATAVQWALDTIEDKKLGLEGKFKEAVDIIRLNNDRLLQLVRDLLETARLDSGKITFNFSAVPVAEIVRQALKSLERDVKENKVNIEIAFEDNLSPVHADRERLKEILEQLLSNAIRFSKTGGTVTVAAFKDTRSILIRIIDRGKGIGPQDEPHVFEKFWHGEDETSRLGTGLGLFIAKELTERMGGSIWFTSMPGQGSTFSVRLRRVG